MSDFRPRSSSEILDAAFEIYRRHFLIFVAISVFASIPWAISSFMSQTAVALPPQVVSPPPTQPSPTDLLRQAYATESPLTMPAPDDALPVVPPIESPPLPSPRPKGADVQRSYTLLSDAQIAAIKDRLQLSPAQAKYWPAVEEALRAVARKMHALRQANPHSTTLAIAPDAPEMQQLKTAATPLLAQLREDQKRDVRALARIIGLDAIASRI